MPVRPTVSCAISADTPQRSPCHDSVVTRDVTTTAGADPGKGGGALGPTLPSSQARVERRDTGVP